MCVILLWKRSTEKIFINNSIILYYSTRVVRGRTISAIKVYDASVVVVIVTMIICYYIYVYVLLHLHNVTWEPAGYGGTRIDEYQERETYNLNGESAQIEFTRSKIIFKVILLLSLTTTNNIHIQYIYIYYHHTPHTVLICLAEYKYIFYTTIHDSGCWFF